MNLKEAFRYQKFLSNMLISATIAVMDEDNCLKTVKVHHCHEANPETQNYIEEVTTGYDPDVLVLFMQSLIDEREKLTKEINNAKYYIGFDLDAAIESNKFRQSVYHSLQRMLSKFRVHQDVNRGQAYKFNVDGNQVPYVYDINVDVSERFDRAEVRKVMRQIIAESDNLSTQIDSAMINVVVVYDPPYDVNDSFEDVITEFQTAIENKQKGEEPNGFYGWPMDCASE